jgi:hypothetical protein
MAPSPRRRVTERNLAERPPLEHHVSAVSVIAFVGPNAVALPSSATIPGVGGTGGTARPWFAARSATGAASCVGPAGTGRRLART